MSDLYGTLLRLLLPDWADYLLKPQNQLVPLKLLLVIGCIGLIVYGRSRTKKRAAGSNRADVKLPPMGAGLLGGGLRNFEQKVTIAGARFDVAWRHIGLLGTSGTRKTTLMAMLLEQIGKTYVCITADHSPALLNLTAFRHGIIWSPRGQVPWYPWGGPLELAVQRVEYLFDAVAGDGGVHRSMLKQLARLAWSETSAQFEKYLKRIRDQKVREALRSALGGTRVDARSRSVEQILDALAALPLGASTRMMVENWSARLTELLDSLEGSLATARDGGFDLVEELAAGTDVMFALNSFADVSNRRAFAKMAALNALFAADVLGRLSMAFDEVGLLGAELFAESVRTLRVRLCTGIFASHIVKDFPSILRGLIGVWFLGQLPEKEDAEWASTKTQGRVPWQHFAEHILPLGRFWLVAGGRIQNVKVPVWETREVPAGADVDPGLPYGNSEFGPDVEPGLPYGNEPAPQVPPASAGTANTAAPEREVTAVTDLTDDEPERLEPLPEWLDPNDSQLVRIYDNVELRGDHRLSLYRKTGRAPGRPQCEYEGQSWYPYVLLKAKQDGLSLLEVKARMGDRSSKGLTYHHRCREIDPSLPAEDDYRCQNLEHGVWKERGGNTAIQWQSRKAAQARERKARAREMS